MEKCETNDEGFIIDVILGTHISPDNLVRDVAGGRVYCFDIHTLYKLYIEKGTFINPFTTKNFSDDAIDRIKKYAQSKLVTVAYNDKLFTFDGEIRLYELIADLYHITGVSYEIDRNLLVNGTPVYNLDPESYIEDYKLGNGASFAVVFGTMINTEKLDEFSEFLRKNENNGKIAKLADLIETITHTVNINIYNEHGGTIRPKLRFNDLSNVGTLVLYMSKIFGEFLMNPFIDIQLISQSKKESIFNISPTTRILSHMNYRQFRIARVPTSNYITVNKELINWIPQNWPKLKETLIELNRTCTMYKKLYSKPDTEINVTTIKGNSFNILVPNNIHVMELLRFAVNYGTYLNHDNIYLGDEPLYNVTFKNNTGKNVSLDKAILNEQISNHLTIKKELANYDGLQVIKRAICSYKGDRILNNVAIDVQVIEIYADEYEVSNQDAMYKYMDIEKQAINITGSVRADATLYNSLRNKATIKIEQLKNELKFDPRKSIINLIDSLPENLNRQQYLLLNDILNRVMNVNNFEY